MVLATLRNDKRPLTTAEIAQRGWQNRLGYRQRARTQDDAKAHGHLSDSGDDVVVVLIVLLPTMMLGNGVASSD